MRLAKLKRLNCNTHTNDILKQMIVAGVMSGTSADGINVALVPRRVGAARLARVAGCQRPRLSTLHRPRRISLSEEGPASRAAGDERGAKPGWPTSLRSEFPAGRAVRGRGAGDAASTSACKAELAGCHGQTLYHQGEAARFLGRQLAATWQTGEGAILAARLGVPVVSDFRPADMAAGGKGAPLVPFLDYLLYRDPRVGRIVQNIGGIANLSAIPGWSIVPASGGF